MNHSTGTPEHTGNEPEQTSEVIFRQFQGKLGKSALQYLPAIVWSAILGVAGVAIFTRLFATDQYGLYTLALTAVTIVVAVVAGWFAVYAFYPVMVYVVTYRHIPWKIPWRSVRNVLLAASAGAAGCFILKGAIAQHIPDWALLILGVADFVFLYVIVLLMLGELTEYEIRFVSKKMRRGRGR